MYLAGRGLETHAIKGMLLDAKHKMNLTFIMVFLHTGTNFPAVSVNSLLAVAMMKTRQRWNGTGVPTQSQLQTACLTLPAWHSQRAIAPSMLQI